MGPYCRKRPRFRGKGATRSECATQFGNLGSAGHWPREHGLRFGQSGRGRETLHAGKSPTSGSAPKSASILRPRSLCETLARLVVHLELRRSRPRVFPSLGHDPQELRIRSLEEPRSPRPLRARDSGTPASRLVPFWSKPGSCRQRSVSLNGGRRSRGLH